MRLYSWIFVTTVIASAPAHAAVVQGAAAADYGRYVQGHLAVADGALDRAAAYFAGALSYAPDDPRLLRQTYELAIAAGDEALAIRVAGRLGQQDRFDSGVALLLVADALKHRRWDAANEATARLSDAGFGSFIVPVIDAWVLDARGRTEKAVVRLSADALDGFAKSYVLEHRAHMLFRAKRYAEAAAVYDELMAGDDGRNVRIRIAAAAALQAAKRNDEALKRLDASTPHPDTAAARARLADGAPILGVPRNASEGVAILALRMAADLTRERPVPVALSLARIATFLTPGDAAGWLMTAELLARGERYGSALAAVRKVPSSSSSAPLARGQEAAILTRLDRRTEALDLLAGATTAPGATAEDWARYGDALQGSERFADAASAYAAAIRIGAADQGTTWRLHFLHGSALEQAGRWAEAEPELREAMRLSPADASLLNYLGYALLDRGQAKAEARGLIEKAHELAPEDGYITDSLGWAQFQADEFAAAVATLERAVASVPDDPVIAEHLGDAYWRVGRRIEARHRWKAALDAAPKPAQAKALAVKYDFGLDVALADARRETAKQP